MTSAPVLVEYLYGIAPGRYDGNDDWQPASIVGFPITRKTPKRIYYDAREWGTRAVVRFVDRHRIEADGEICRRSAGWWEPDSHLYLNPPPAPSPGAPAADLVELKAAMAAAHPDVGGTDAGFIAARERYERAKAVAS